ncbi:MAG: hypothetical protein M9949_11180 [Candidatus Kapabacteria bacterium]|nr:hypothetical protein [Candidatus Kapabacteria bacterium]
MKYLTYLTVFFAFTLFTFAQPTTITYQGKLLDNNNLPIIQTGMSITFAIYSSQTGGTKLWPSGTAATKTVDVIQGLYSVFLGTGTGNDDAFTAGMFATYSPWLEVVVDGSKLPRTPLTNVPFSLLANHLSDEGWASPGEIGSTAPNSGAFSSVTVGTGTTTYTLPTAKGSENQHLMSNSDGTTSWTTGAVPSLTQAQILAINNPINGYLVFNSDDNKFYSFISTDFEWKEISFGAGSLRYTSAYSIGSGSSCSNTTVSGEYLQGVALNSSNYVSLQADVTQKGAWSITTNTLNGYSFSGTGNFVSTGNNTVVLYGNGTPGANQSSTFTATAYNSGGTCTFIVSMDYGTVVSGGGRTWMNRNLGASQVATSSTDAASFGELYQWGRAAEGHQVITSSTSTTLASTAVPNLGNSWDAKFIINESTEDWLSPSSNSMWQGVSGPNNPCPAGFRIPTETEWNTEISSWSGTPFESPLKLPYSGMRESTDGSIVYNFSGILLGSYWSSTPGTQTYLARALTILSNGTKAMQSGRKAHGMSVRCIKDE